MSHPDFENIDTCGEQHLLHVDRLASLLMQTHRYKEQIYGGSWAKRGFVGIWFTVIRPWDRLENTFKDLEKYSKSRVLTRAFFDSLMDVALYMLKWAALVADTDPGILTSWMKDVNNFPDGAVKNEDMSGSNTITEEDWKEPVQHISVGKESRDDD